MGDNAGVLDQEEDMTAPQENSTTTPTTKSEHQRDASTSDDASTPEQDAETFPQESQQTQKRKGGRKPIYATSEERKQRNRQAQAAFRERRTEYIKQLETTIKQHEEALRTLQANHRSAMDECLLLRYKNSLLERILLEKGIDVQGELQAKTGSPNFPPSQAQAIGSAPLPQGAMQSPMHHAMMNRQHQARRSGSHMTTKVEGVGAPTDGMIANPSPRLQPTPASHSSSPAIASTRSPNFIPQAGMTSPSVGSLAQQQQQMRSPQSSRPRYNHVQPTPPQRPQISTNINRNGPISAGLSSAGSGVSGSAGPSSFYPSPFRSHMDQLDQEYDAQADMYEDNDGDQSAGPGPYPYGGQQISPQGMGPPATPTQPFQPTPSQANAQVSSDSAPQVFPPPNHSFESFDPMLDADPFGLSASMHFPTQFSYESR